MKMKKKSGILKMEERMKTNHKGNKTANFVKGVFFVAFLGLASGCGGGGANPGQSMTAENGFTGSSVVEGSVSTVANHLNAKMDLCAQVNGWATDCRFVGMKYLNQAQMITPLTEEFSGKNRGRGRGV